jgi:hypothetical protein
MKSEQEIAQPTKPSTSSNLIYRFSIGTLITAALLVILGLVSFVQNNAQQAALDEQSRKTNELVEQVKDLSEQNKKLSQTAVNYAYCNSVILARYTQNRQPITVEDLNKCVISSFPEGEGAPTLEDIRANMSGASSPFQENQVNQNQNGNSNPTPTSPTPTPENPTPQNPQNPIQNTPSNNILTLNPSPLLPGLELNAPCLQITNLLGTCKLF